VDIIGTYGVYTHIYT